MSCPTPRLPMLLLILVTGLLAAAGGCSRDPAAPPAAADKAAVTDDPSADEIEDLLFTREEEKMARDVYLVLGETYPLKIFVNIAESEQRHMDAVGNLVAAFGLVDPVGDNEVGEFTNPVIGELYGQLVADGEASVTAALMSGLEIEEIDIIDLWGAMDRAEIAAIDEVYENLCDGSKNHLRSFVAAWEERTGLVYAPRWLTQAEFDAIMDGDSNRRARTGRSLATE
jgi:hypothetical protein